MKSRAGKPECRGRYKRRWIYPGKSFLVVLFWAVISLTLSPGEAKADGPAFHLDWLEKWNLTLGISLKEQRIHVKESFSGDEFGRLASGYQPSVLVDIGSPYNYFGRTNFGWYVLYSFRHFDIKEQLVGEGRDSRDMGTSASGYMMYLTPIVFWEPPRDDVSVTGRIGAGAGVGYVNASGDVIFTETDEMQKHRIDISDAAFTVGLLMEIIQDSILLRISMGIGMVNKGGLYYEVPDIAVEFGYVF